MYEPDENTTTRLDLWLWAVRIFKTRNVASTSIKNGRVMVNGVRRKPAAQVAVNDCITVQKPPFEYVLYVEKVISKRVGAPIAQTCYREDPASIQKRAEVAEQVALNARSVVQPKGRPTKKARRAMNDWKWSDSSEK